MSSPGLNVKFIISYQQIEIICSTPNFRSFLWGAMRLLFLNRGVRGSTPLRQIVLAPLLCTHQIATILTA
jgi:hypothetical protein